MVHTLGGVYAGCVASQWCICRVCSLPGRYTLVYVPLLVGIPWSMYPPGICPGIPPWVYVQVYHPGYTVRLSVLGDTAAAVDG